MPCANILGLQAFEFLLGSELVGLLFARGHLVNTRVKCMPNQAKAHTMTTESCCPGSKNQIWLLTLSKMSGCGEDYDATPRASRSHRVVVVEVGRWR